MNIAPRRLNPGDHIAIVAPSSPFESDELQQGLNIMRQYGLVPVLGPNVKGLKSLNIHAAPLIDRVDELMWAFSDPTIKGVFAATGGYGAISLLPYLDYEVIRQSRKPLLGMSDVTALNAGILARAGLISINGQYPAIELSKGQKRIGSDAESLSLTLKLLMSDQLWGTDPFSINQYIPRTVVGGRASGVAVGCNLHTLMSMYGTSYFPELEGAILFIEGVHGDPEQLGRQILQLQLGGTFDKLAGIVVGEFCDVPKHEPPRHPSFDEILIELISDTHIPCVTGYSFSHGDWTIPVPVGAMTEMDADSGEIAFEFSMALVT